MNRRIGNYVSGAQDENRTHDLHIASELSYSNW